MRLIDADALRARMYHESFETDSDMQKWDSGCLIRCKECKYSEHWYKDKRRCFLWAEDGIDVFEDGYCNYAEGKEE